MFKFHILLCLLTLTAPAAIAQTAQKRSIEIVDGRKDRSKPAPLIIAMHGFLGNAQNMQRKTGFDDLAAQYGFVVIYPNGLKRRWNDGRSRHNRTDDVGYLTALIKHMVSSGQARADKIFLTGHSNGGGMAMRMACDHPDLIRGISVVATKALSNYQCSTGAPIPALFIHGTADPIAPHEGRDDASRLGGTLSSTKTAALWKARNRCTNDTRSQIIDHKKDGTSVQITRYTKCRASLNYVVIEGHGHDWPSTKGKATRLQGPATQEIDATELSWEFFKRL